MPIDVLGTLAIPASALLWGLLVNRQLGNYAESPYKKQRPISAKKRKKILKMVGAHPSTPVVTSPYTEMEGEFYVPPSEVDTAMEFGLVPAYKQRSNMYSRAKKHGIIGMRKKPTEHTLAHEAGHAAHEREGAWHWPRVLSNIGMVAAPIGSYFMSRYMGPKGVGLGTLAGLAMATPQLWSELKASWKADKYLGKEKKKWAARRRLGAAFLTYLGAAAVPAAAAGGVGLYRHYNPKSRFGIF
jgi:hypothetical protein